MTDDIERDERGCPIPDGHLHIVTGIPLNPVAPIDDAKSYDAYFYFKDIDLYTEVPTGIRVTLPDHNFQIIPWSNIRTWDIKTNSEVFREQHDLWVLNCDHDMTTFKQADSDGEEVTYCKNCMFTEERIKQVQRSVDQRLLIDLENSLGKVNNEDS